MKKLFVFVSIAIVAIALGGCQKEAEMTDGQEVITEESAADVEDIQAEEEPWLYKRSWFRKKKPLLLRNRPQRPKLPLSRKWLTRSIWKPSLSP
ncbi:MAG: hypothetical protein ACYSQY_05985 [Planctomycetota bacterium]